MTWFLQFMVVLRLNQCATEPHGEPVEPREASRHLLLHVLRVHLVLSWFQFLFLFLMFPSC